MIALRVTAGLGMALVMALGVAMTADVGASNLPIPERAMVRARGGAVLENWPANERRFAHPSGQHELPPGFHDDLVASGFVSPTALRFLPNGSLFVTEQRGTLVHYRIGDAASDRVVLDLRADVFNHHQLGLLGLGIDPQFETEPFVYLLYTRDAMLGGQSPTYGTGTDEDPCPNRGLCPASGRLVRVGVDVTGTSATGRPDVLLDEWCSQASNHTIGNIAFDATGALLASAGDGSDGANPDFGQIGSPPNACGDPPAEAGDPVTPPTTEGGSLRSQDLRLGTDPVALSGTIIRVDRRTGEGLPDNPLAGASDQNARRIVAYGLRNPYRFTFRPGTDEMWIADVGWATYEEIDVLSMSAGERPPNYGWPCYEGAYRQAVWDEMGSEACRDLYLHESDVTFPAMSFAHAPRTRKRGCWAAGSALTTIRFYDGDMFPAAYRGALFLTDLARQCLFVIQPDEHGLPDPLTARQFARRFNAVDMVVGPDGALYYVDVYRGELRRITHRM